VANRKLVWLWFEANLKLATFAPFTPTSLAFELEALVFLVGFKLLIKDFF
jgi:hypothetical protein